ncbi:15-hydroxyprostaglandin dehydrogenase [NAD(+)]-like [Argopecten irradians]|uniref:15-hydroxyprostaglandin dehydrogenase [NAD(+)]-like n=1 Tax=Argopecten irradians TaxID=31199 RepID=UPI00371BA6EC
MDLPDKVVVITGAAKGIGKALARGVLEKGAKVCFSDINEELGAITRRDLATSYGEDRVAFVHCDVRDDEQFKNVFQVTKDKFKQVDIVVNNAGVCDEEDWEKTVAVNLTGCIRGTILGAEALRTDLGGNGGVVVNMCSVFGYQPSAFLPVYAATKYGVFGITKSYAAKPEMKENGVKFTCLCPGAVATDLITEEIQQVRQKLLNTTSLMSTDVIVEALFKLLIDTDNNGGALIVNDLDPDHHMKYVGNIL